MGYNFFIITRFSIIYLLIGHYVLFSETTNSVDTKEKVDVADILPKNEALLNTLKYGTSNQKVSAISSISKRKNHSDMDIIIGHYPNEVNIDVKVEILKVFSKYKYQNAKEIILLALDDENALILKEAYNLSSIYHDKIFESNLADALKEETGTTRDNIINTLSTMKSTLVSDYLIEIYSEEKTKNNTKVEILRYFSENGDIKGEEISREAAIKNTDNTTFQRYMGIIALGKYPNEENYKILQDILKEDVPELSARVIYVLANFEGYSDVKKDIIEAAKNDNDSVRLYAIKALKSYVGDKYVDELLLYRLKNDNLESISLAILDMSSDSLNETMKPAIIELAESSNNVNLKNKAREVLDKYSVVYKK